MFNLDFLNNYYEKMCDELLQMFDQRKDAIERFQGEYVFSGRDWHTGEQWHVIFLESIQYDEQLKVAHLKQGKKTTTPAEFQQQG